MLASRCKNVTALDYDPKIISGFHQILKQKGIENVTPKVADMAQTGLPDNYADLVLMSQVLHHATDPRLALKEATRILKPGGRLALLDLAQHKEESFRTTHGHIWLGFERSQLEFFVKELNCKVLESEIIPSENEVDKKLPVICMIITKE
jgi:demethylmenaquinone methyltransferase/2-methoxy-6-polyprenyl-1,4-benzoquinol methylase/ArsR family transcriptional regulator